MRFGALAVSLFISASMCAVCILLFTADIPPISEKFAIMIFGSLITSFGQMTQYWLGATAAGEKKDEAIANVATTATTTAGTIASTAGTIATTAGTMADTAAKTETAKTNGHPKP